MRRDVGAERVGCLVIDAMMGIAVAAKLVSAVDDAANRSWMALGDPAQGEEGACGRRHRRKGRSTAVRVALDPARITVPVDAVDALGKRLNLEVVLDVDAHGVAHERVPTRDIAPRCGFGWDARLVVHL